MQGSADAVSCNSFYRDEVDLSQTHLIQSGCVFHQIIESREYHSRLSGGL